MASEPRALGPLPGADAAPHHAVAAPRLHVPWPAFVPIVAVLAVMYHRTATGLWSTWTTNENYSHGPLIPLISLALVWLRRDKLAALPVRPDARGLLLLALGCGILIVGLRADLFALQCYSMIAVLFGLSLTFGGMPRTRMLAFPILYLIFMMTFPPFVMNQLGYALKEFATGAAVRLSEALGVTLQRSGMSIYLASGVLRIENPCSGLRSLLALFATGLLFAYFQPGGNARRAMVLLAAIPIAVLGNIVRLALLMIVGHYVSVTYATGAFHDWTGYVLYAVALGTTLLVRHLVSPREPAAARPEPRERTA